ncbi:hypothetical protein GA0070624_0928 [Micromonospora rhizosphaerae]|uniref:Lipoprotein n=1 Tax=Micromonospora rhizosphaerae TaxID=568872 RepID=A0A1C6RG22_9ACTN|nr:hypothetical protein [Micromonospora rhizosphaerae]SCL16117.1 hypothetical protein GA0070624_0928 [Micromonospora rhizosphaerae]
MIYPRWQRPLAGGLGTAALILALAGCGGEDKAPGVATAGSPGTRALQSAGTGGAVAQYVEAQRRWVKCLREQGFDLPDPDAKGFVDLRAPGAPKKADPKWTAAQMTCMKYNMPVPEELEEKAVWTAEEIVHRRAYAQCMRDNGLPDFPDPGPDGNWPRETGSGQISEQQAAAEFRAGQICNPVLDGKPPTTPDPNSTAKG